MRIFGPEVLVRDFKDLGFTTEDASQLGGLTGEAHGILLVTGPTGSGKTTTLYSTLKQIATPESERLHHRGSDRDDRPAVEPDAGAAGDRPRLRRRRARADAPGPGHHHGGRDPRPRYGDMAVQAALTGHLVLSTLHTNDAPSSITRLLDLGVPAYLFNSTLLGIMAQRLVRTLWPRLQGEGAVPPREEHALWARCARRAGDPPEEVIPAGGLPRMPHYRLPGPRRHLRDLRSRRRCGTC